MNENPLTFKNLVEIFKFTTNEKNEYYRKWEKNVIFEWSENYGQNMLEIIANQQNKNSRSVMLTITKNGRTKSREYKTPGRAYYAIQTILKSSGYRG